MGSVPHLYTTGDNDPEIEPVRYYRHYLYCDACGSFELESWTSGKNPGFEPTRRRLPSVALVSLLVVLTAGWSALGLYPSPAVLLLLAAAMVIAPVLWGMGWRYGKEGVAARWRFTKVSLLLVPVALVVEEFASPPFPAWAVALVGLVVLVGSLVARESVDGKLEYLGMRCRKCGRTYGKGTAFFTNLDANPRGLSLSEVPRPLGRSEFLRGKDVDDGSPAA
jgi:hypothetical protein